MKMLSLVFCLSLAMSAFAAKTLTPTALNGAKGIVMDGKEAKKLIDSGVTPIDARPKIEYVEGHLPNAKVVSYKSRSANKEGFDLGKDKFKVKKIAKFAKKSDCIMLYCNGQYCWQSYKAARWLIEKESYQCVYWFRGGMPAWKEAGFSVAK